MFLSGFWRNNLGNVTVSFALSLGGLAICSFGAVNMASINYAETKLQAASDSAALAVAANLNYDTYRKAAENYVKSNTETEGTLKNISVITTFDQGKNQWTVKSTGESTNAMAAVFGKSIITATAVSTATPDQTLQQLQFKPGNAKGWFNKKVTLYAKYDDDKEPEALWSMTYVYNASNQSKSITQTSDSWVNIKNAKEIYLEMDIDKNSTGFNKFGTYLSNRTDKPDLIKYIMVGNTALNKPLDLFSAAGCGETVKYRWEDGGDFDYLDFWFEATGKCESNSGGTSARLVY